LKIGFFINLHLHNSFNLNKFSHPWLLLQNSLSLLKQIFRIQIYVRKLYIIFSLSLVCNLNTAFLLAQSSDSMSSWSLSAYADVYYAKYSDEVSVGNFQQFASISPRNNSFGLNVLQISSQYDGPNFRAAATLHYGDVPSSSWSQNYNAIQEAHVGVRILKTLWLDAGFFKTHFGTEYLMPKDNIASSLAMISYYEPFYESGVRLNFDPTKNLEINLFLLNGYNMFIDNNNTKSFGMGITYLLGDKGNIGYTDYIGDDAPPGSSLPHTRFANNLFLNYNFSRKLTVQAGGDFFVQQNSDLFNLTKPGIAYGALGTLKYQVKSRFAVYERTDFFYDGEGILSPAYTYPNGNQLGYTSVSQTTGVEYKPSENSYIRVEYRRINMLNNEDIFITNHRNVDYRNDLMVNMGVNFDLLKGSQNKK